MDLGPGGVDSGPKGVDSGPERLDATPRGRRGKNVRRRHRTLFNNFLLSITTSIYYSLLFIMIIHSLIITRFSV
jgi:hypothetical protein